MVTGDKKGAGTDANVSITIHGKSGQTAKLPLKSKSKETFEVSPCLCICLRIWQMMSGSSSIYASHFCF